MQPTEERETLLARCVVCRGNIWAGEAHELWEGGYYCERHSVRYLRERAREFAALVREESASSSQ
jgi:hypothetical protein